MNKEMKIGLFQTIFSIQSDEMVLILIDTPHNQISDTEVWQKRRMMADEWFKVLQEMGQQQSFTVELQTFPATGMNNAPAPDQIKSTIRKHTLVLAMTEFSISSTLALICEEKDTITRCASMPGIEKRMEETALLGDYMIIQQYAENLKSILEKAVSATIDFSSDDSLFIDLRNRSAIADNGKCWKPGVMINLPSGEAAKAPYEAVKGEIGVFGKSKTRGILPFYDGNEIIKFIVEENHIVDLMASNTKKQTFLSFFKENETRRNIAELGIGCNPYAIVTGNVLEDEKVPGLHIAYGMSAHLGGKIYSDMHQDICYPKGAPIEASSLVLKQKNGESVDLIKDAELQFALFE